MDKLYEELAEAKTEIEKLRAEFQTEKQISSTLKKAHHEQLAKFQEANLEIEKQNATLREKEEQTSFLTASSEELNCAMEEKNLIIKQMTSATEKLRVSLDQKLQTLEMENRSLVLALDQANESRLEQEQKSSSMKEEIERLKNHLSVLPKKFSEDEEKAKNSRNLGFIQEHIVKLEEERSSIADELKWKKEQFNYLEEAHEKLRSELKRRNGEWENEKKALVDELCHHQSRLDSQSRISDDLQKQLKICNEALVHELNRMKRLENQFPGSKAYLCNTMDECEDAKPKMESLAAEIAGLRNSLSRSRVLYKEMVYKAGKLEDENRDLRACMKELQESQIQEAGASSSLGKLKTKLKSLEQIHRSCSANLKAKEDGWNIQRAKLESELEGCRSSLNNLTVELEASYSQLFQSKLQNEENQLMLLVLRSGMSQAMREIENQISDIELLRREKEEEVAVLIKRLEEKNVLLKSAAPAHNEMKKKKQASVESLKDLMMQMESQFQEQISQVCDALDAANSELIERISDESEVEFELQLWRSTAERLKADLEESHDKRREIESSLLAQIEVEESLKQEKDKLLCFLEEKDFTINNLQRQIISLDQAAEEEDDLLQIIEERDNMIDRLQKLASVLEEKVEELNLSFSSTIEEKQAEINSIYEKQRNVLQLVEEKDCTIENLQRLVRTLEEKVILLNFSLSAQLEGKQSEINSMYEAWQRSAAAEVLMEREIRVKQSAIEELEGTVKKLQLKLELQELDLHSASQYAEIKAESEAKRQIEWEKLTDELQNKLKASKASEMKLQCGKTELSAVIARMASERENIIAVLEKLHQSAVNYAGEDTKLMEIMSVMVQSVCGNEVDMELDEEDELNDNLRGDCSPAKKRYETPTAITRSPFKEINS